MNVIIAINNEKIFKEIKKQNNINIISKDIQYKEGIIEILEKNKNVQYIIINENLFGQIKIEKLINKIKNINSKINILIILNRKDLNKEKYLLENKIKFIYEENLTVENILQKIFNKNKIIAISGTEGSGKTITTLILSELLIKNKNNKILIIDDNIKNNSITQIYKIKNKKENTENKKTNNEIKNNKIIKIKNNLYLLNIKKLLINYKKDKIKIINEINKIKNNFKYIFIDTQNINSYKIYEKIIDENIVIINSNILEINKVKKFILNKKTKIILNNYNINSISDEILKKIFKNKIKIIGKIKNNKNYNLIINNNFNINYLDPKNKNIFFNIIKNI